MFTVRKGEGLEKGIWQIRDGHVVMNCPSCGAAGNLDETHSIDKMGCILPSVDCPCGKFHDYVRLENYAGAPGA